MRNPYELALRRRDRFRAWASIGMLLGFYAVIYVSMDLHGVQGAALGMAYSAAIGWFVWRERVLQREADAIYKELTKASDIPAR